MRAVAREEPAANDADPEEQNLNGTGRCCVQHGLVAVVADGINDEGGKLEVMISRDTVGEGS